MPVQIKVLGPYPSCTLCDQAGKEAQNMAARFPGQVEVKHLDMMTAEFGMYKAMVPLIILVNNELVSTGKVVTAEKLGGLINLLIK